MPCAISISVSCIAMSFSSHFFNTYFFIFFYLSIFVLPKSNLLAGVGDFEAKEKAWLFYIDVIIENTKNTAGGKFVLTTDGKIGKSA